MKSDEIQHLFVLDNTVLTNFAIIDRSDLILELWADACATTSSVINEYQIGVYKGRFAEDAWKYLSILDMDDRELEFCKVLPPKLGEGERSCIAIAVYRKGVFVSDDLPARKVAKQHQIPLIGTLGVLVTNIHKKSLSLTAGNQLLESMIDSGYRSPMSSLDELI